MPYLRPIVQRARLVFYKELVEAHIVARSTPDPPPDFFNVSQVLFAYLSVIIGLLALIVGLLQLRRYQRRHFLTEENPVFELEADYSWVSDAYTCIASRNWSIEQEALRNHNYMTNEEAFAEGNNARSGTSIA
jgi:hypothetical protein